MRSKRVDDRGLLGEAVALALVDVVLDGRRPPARIESTSELRLRGRHHLVVVTLEHEHRHGDLARRG